MVKIKVSEEEHKRRKELNLPVTKPLRYMKRFCGSYEEIPVRSYETIKVLPESNTHILSVELESGEVIKIMADFFSEMQKPSFVEDMQRGEEG